MEALENLDIVAFASFIALAVAWVILPLKSAAVVTPAVELEAPVPAAVAA